MKSLLLTVFLGALWFGTFAQDSPVKDPGRIRFKSARSFPDAYYPLALKRFYDASGGKLVWLSRDQKKLTQVYDALLLLDCVIQYGLQPGDYHNDKLSFERLKAVQEMKGKTGEAQRLEFDLLLSDALITFINHLHFGKFNPDYSSALLDKAPVKGFDATVILRGALAGRDFRAAILNVQPKTAAYRQLQAHMRLMNGQYTGDCYEFPEGEVRKIAMNMERAKWNHVAYQTCAVKDGVPVFFDDPDKLDEKLEKLMFK
ncbi:hypothetical protein [Pedobacter deserti]|uniref:hypothetical protein n=1 Tax=Pedobacter deserti TaxID=2817382 RepID=UPI0021090398|nr:hypothetical protein [Pedobacter sp. SYSU D00382]